MFLWLWVRETSLGSRTRWLASQVSFSSPRSFLSHLKTFSVAKTPPDSRRIPDEPLIPTNWEEGSEPSKRFRRQLVPRFGISLRSWLSVDQSKLEPPVSEIEQNPNPFEECDLVDLRADSDSSRENSDSPNSPDPKTVEVTKSNICVVELICETFRPADTDNETVSPFWNSAVYIAQWIKLTWFCAQFPARWIYRPPTRPTSWVSGRKIRVIQILNFECSERCA